ncbi:uncharacterized protein LOC116015918 [Ipomoea triloba]|uniref:uncharacterized protein LOC116015918 n=1 Tax=Ipomoea triloba TaxID=35885 RepID=UPI00125DAE05|nr:uncharacterized protein LOC116015918 [Ipomoea triloba]
MAKAYDRMEWPFLRKMMLALGFSVDWVNLVMLCVTTVSYNFLVNGTNLVRLFPHVAFAREIHYHHIYSLSVLRVSRYYSSRLKLGEIFMAVNFHKSSVCFSRNTSEIDRDIVATVLGVVQAPNFGKYLGLPSFVGRENRAVFSYIEDKIKHKIGSWSKKLISQAGKERIMNRYWWGIGNEKGIHWKAWDRLCVPKKFGGLGFKDLRAFNLAMLGKQAWRFLTRPQSLVARIYKARYFPKTSFIDATLGTCPSYYWRSVMAAHELVCSGVRRRVGDGKATLIWGHPWLPDEPDPMIQTSMPQELDGSLVSGLLDPATVWNESSLHVPSVGGDDFGEWFASALCMLTEDDVLNIVALLYHIWKARNSAVWEGSLPHPRSVWRAARAAVFAWRQVHNAADHHPPPQAAPNPEVHTVALLCYVDAGYRHQTKEATVGALLLTQNGDFVAAFNARLPHCFSPLMAESLACKEALSWLKDRGINSVHIYTDCSTLKNLLVMTSTSLFSYVGFSIDASRAIMSSFIRCSVSLIPRTTNRGTHTLATLTFSQVTALYWDAIPLLYF